MIPADVLKEFRVAAKENRLPEQEQLLFKVWKNLDDSDKIGEILPSTFDNCDTVTESPGNNVNPTDWSTYDLPPMLNSSPAASISSFSTLPSFVNNDHTFTPFITSPYEEPMSIKSLIDISLSTSSKEFSLHPVCTTLEEPMFYVDNADSVPNSSQICVTPTTREQSTLHVDNADSLPNLSQICTTPTTNEQSTSCTDNADFSLNFNSIHVTPTKFREKGVNLIKQTLQIPDSPRSNKENKKPKDKIFAISSRKWREQQQLEEKLKAEAEVAKELKKKGAIIKKGRN